MTFPPRRARAQWNKGILMVMLVSVAVLAACQSTTPVSTLTPDRTDPTVTPVPQVTLPATATPTALPSPTPPAHLDFDREGLKGQAVEIWHPWKDDLASRFNALAAEFNRSNEWGIQVTVKPLHSSGELYDAVNTVLESGESALPGAVVAATDQLAAWDEEHDVVVDLTGYIEHPQAGMSGANLKAYQPVFWAQDQAAQGPTKQLALPGLRTAQVLFYNVTWAKELGFSSAPRTPDEFRAQACAAAVKNNAARVIEMYGTGGWLIDTSALTTLSWLSAFGADPLPDAEGQPYRFESPEAEETLEYLRGLLDNGCAWLGRTASPYEAFAARKALFYTASLQEIQIQAGWQKRLGSADEWIILPFPGADGKPVIYANGYSYALFDTPVPENQAASWLFIRWLSQPENTARLSEALPSIPVSSAVASQLSADAGSFPMNAIIPLADEARSAPGLASWRQARRLLEDASWQIYHLPVEAVPQILPQLDAAVQEMVFPQ